MSSFDLEITLDLSCAGGIFAHDVDAIATIDYEAEVYRRNGVIVDADVNGWDMVDIRFPNVCGEITNRDWLWPLFHQAVQDQREWVEKQIREHAMDDDSSDYAYDMARGNFEPAANLLGVSK